MMCVGCAQNKTHAIKEICTIPTKLHDDPTKVGPYLEKRVTHPDIVEMLYNASDIAALRKVITDNGFSAESCDFIRILEQDPK